MRIDASVCNAQGLTWPTGWLSAEKVRKRPLARLLSRPSAMIEGAGLWVQTKRA
jgi:hypothetical protein